MDTQKTPKAAHKIWHITRSHVCPHLCQGVLKYRGGIKQAANKEVNLIPWMTPGLVNSCIFVCNVSGHGHTAPTPSRCPPRPAKWCFPGRMWQACQQKAGRHGQFVPKINNLGKAPWKKRRDMVTERLKGLKCQEMRCTNSKSCEQSETAAQLPAFKRTLMLRVAIQHRFVYIWHWI